MLYIYISTVLNNHIGGLAILDRLTTRTVPVCCTPFLPSFLSYDPRMIDRVLEFLFFFLSFSYSSRFPFFNFFFNLINNCVFFFWWLCWWILYFLTNTIIQLRNYKKQHNQREEYLISSSSFFFFSFFIFLFYLYL